MPWSRKNWWLAIWKCNLIIDSKKYIVMLSVTGLFVISLSWKSSKKSVNCMLMMTEIWHAHFKCSNVHCLSEKMSRINYQCCTCRSEIWVGYAIFHEKITWCGNRAYVFSSNVRNGRYSLHTVFLGKWILYEKYQARLFGEVWRKSFKRLKNSFLSKKHFLKLVFYVKVRTMEDEEVVGYEEGTSAVRTGTRLIYAHVRFHHSIFTLACWHDDETNPQRENVVK